MTALAVARRNFIRIPHELEATHGQHSGHPLSRQTSTVALLVGISCERSTRRAYCFAQLLLRLYSLSIRLPDLLALVGTDSGGLIRTVTALGLCKQ